MNSYQGGTNSETIIHIDIETLVRMIERTGAIVSIHRGHDKKLEVKASIFDGLKIKTL
jgi:hypothetical protein